MWVLNGNSNYLTERDAARVLRSPLDVHFMGSGGHFIASDGESHVYAGDRIVADWRTETAAAESAPVFPWPGRTLPPEGSVMTSNLQMRTPAQVMADPYHDYEGLADTKPVLAAVDSINTALTTTFAQMDKSLVGAFDDINKKFDSLTAAVAESNRSATVADFNVTEVLGKILVELQAIRTALTVPTSRRVDPQA
jgi:hypothetical protein